MKQRAVLQIPADHPAFPGHFPGMPIVPGVLLLDEAIHAILEEQSLAPQDWRVGAVKFLSPLGPDAVVVIEHETQANGTIHFDIMEGDRRIATGSLTPDTP